MFHGFSGTVNEKLECIGDNGDRIPGVIKNVGFTMTRSAVQFRNVGDSTALNDPSITKFIRSRIRGPRPVAIRDVGRLRREYLGPV